MSVYYKFQCTCTTIPVYLSQLHNLAWECAFGRDVGFSPDQSLALHVEHGTTNTRVFDSIPHPWQPELILRDFDDFWGHLETLNDKLDGK